MIILNFKKQRRGNVMIIVMKQNFSEENLNNVINTIGNLGLTAHLSRGEHTTLI